MAGVVQAGVISICIFAILQLCWGENIPGVVQLNSETFDKLLPKFNTILVKFDETYPYGDKQETFKELAKTCVEQTELLLAEIHVADYGDKENQDLADRYKVHKDDFPLYKVFVDGKESATYTGDVKKVEEIKKFLIKESGLWLGLPSCIEEFDNLIKDFFASDFASDRQKIVDKAKKMAAAIKDSDKNARANVYVKTMQKVVEKGDDFIVQEIARVEKLQSEKVSDKKKLQLRERSNILTSFQMRMKGQLLGHEEL